MADRTDMRSPETIAIQKQLGITGTTNGTRMAQLRALAKRNERENMRKLFAAAPCNQNDTHEDMKNNLLALVAEEIDLYLPRIHEGQGLGIIFKLVIQNEDKTFEDEHNRRGTTISRQWTNAVLKRDGYACVECGAKGDIFAHHIEEWATSPDKRFDVANGITLCREHHAEKHPDKRAFILNTKTKRDRRSKV